MLIAYSFAGLCLPIRCLEMDVYSDLHYSGFRAICHIIYVEVENWEEMSRADSLEGTEENNGSPSKYKRYNRSH